MKVSLEDIQQAQQRLKNITVVTELSHSISASKLLGTDIFLKFENTQRAGSFKLRGAYNKISSLSAEEKVKGVIASSAGNHAQGVALSASLLGVRSHIIMPETAPLGKMQATQSYGAEIELYGEVVDDATRRAKELVEKHGYIFVHPYEDEKVIAGQGTMGLELLAANPELDTIIVPIGGGGMISGIAVAVKALKPSVRVIGVQSVVAPGMQALFTKSPMAPVQKRVSTIADGIAIKYPSQIMYESFISKFVDEVVTVTDDEIAEAIVFLLERAKTVCEGAGAVGMAAAMNGKVKLGPKTAIVLSGGNIDLNIVAKIIEKGQTKRGRLVELSVIVDDLPGNLARLTAAIAEQKANVIEVKHDRISQGLYLRETQIDFVLETTSHDHIDRVRQALAALGARIKN